MFRTLAALGVAFSLTAVANAAEFPATATVTACFTPGPTSCAELIADRIDAAQTKVRVQAYYLTSPTILHAIAAANAVARAWKRSSTRARIAVQRAPPLSAEKLAHRGTAQHLVLTVYHGCCLADHAGIQHRDGGPIVSVIPFTRHSARVATARQPRRHAQTLSRANA